MSKVKFNVNPETVLEPFKGDRALTDAEFISVWEHVAQGENPSKDEVVRLTGLSMDNVSKRIAEVRAKFKDSIAFTSMPRGGKKKAAANVASMVEELAKLGLVSTKLDPPENKDTPEGPPEANEEGTNEDEWEDVEDDELEPVS